MSIYDAPDLPIKNRFSDFLSRYRLAANGRIDEYGMHPTCFKCRTRLRAGCKHPQYDAPGVLLFRCLDFRK